jgi:transcriptional regulator with XRE-family HTH domain
MSTVVTNDEAKDNIAFHLEELMEKAGRPSLREIADATGESHTAIRQYLNGEKMAGSGPLMRLAEYFSKSLRRKITTDYLLSSPPNGNGKK